MHNKILGGIPMREAVRESGLSLQAYVEDVKTQQWASGSELEAACMVYGVSMHLLQQGVRTPITLNYQGINNINSDTVRSASIMLTYNITVTHLRQILAGLFELDPDSFYLHLPEDEGNPLTDWADLPDMVIMSGGHEPTPRPEITIHMPSGATFRMDYVATENHQQFLERISSIINLPTRAFRTTFEGGASWLFPYDLEYEDAIHISVVRGGMRSTMAASSRSRSVSPTTPFRHPNIGGELQCRIMPEPEYHMEEDVIHVNASPVHAPIVETDAHEEIQQGGMQQAPNNQQEHRPAEHEMPHYSRTKDNIHKKKR